MTDSTKDQEVCLQPDLSTMTIRVQKEDEDDRVFHLDVTNVVLAGEEVERKHIPADEKEAKAWKCTPAFCSEMADCYNAANLLPGVTITPTGAYHIYFDAVGRWADLKKNMSFMRTLPSSTEPGNSSEGHPPENSAPDSEPT